MPLAVFLVCDGPPARASDTSRKLREEIERLLSDMASELRDVPGDSSTSDLARTVDYAARVADKARELKYSSDDDPDGRRMADYYPDIAGRYRDYSRYLIEMKDHQRKLDDQPRRCEEATRELTSRLRSYTDTHDPRGLDEVPRLARDFGRIGKEVIALAEQVSREQSARFDRVDDFSDSEGRWSDVRTNLHAAGRAILDVVKRQDEQLRRDDVCGNLAKDERNPLIEEAMRKLLDGKKGIELLYEQMDRQLTEIASYLDRLEGDSSDGDIGYAEAKLGELERNLDQLDRIRGNDGEARRRVETWRVMAQGAREAWKQLRVLKQAQFLADRAPEKCRESTAQLEEIIRGFVSVQDTKGKTVIPLRARGIAEPIKAGLAKTDEQHSTMERALSDAQRFDASEGRWREVRDKHRASATAIWEYWKKARDVAHATCDELAKGDGNPTVVKAVAAIDATLSSNQRELVLLENEYERWYSELMELRSWYKQDTAAVRELLCTMEESPGDSEAGREYYAKVDQIADRMRDRLSPRWALIMSKSQMMIGTADGLLARKDDEVQKGAQKVKDKVGKVMSALTNLMNDELRGSNDPELRAKMETGKNEHVRIQADSSKCTVAELTVGSRRIDCIRVDGTTCYVVEIKPNNSAAQERGRQQIRSGIKEIKDALSGAKKKAEIDKLPDKLHVFKACFDDSKSEANLEVELRVYELCPPDGLLFKDFVVP